MTNRKVEKFVPVVRYEGLKTDKAATFGGAITATSTVGFSGTFTAASGTATTAGGALGLQFGSSPALGIYFGSGAPSATAPKGSLYLRTDGSSTSTRAYINTDGATTWTAITTAA